MLGVAVNSAQRVTRREPYGYLLAATMKKASSLFQTQGFPASIKESDLDGGNRFVTKEVNAQDFSDSSVRHAGDINGDSTDCLS